MTDSFEKWINGMNEDMYEDWLEDTATDLQQEKALNIRTPLNEQETEDIEAEQTFEQPSKVVEVYDNRDLPPKRVIAEITLDPITNMIRRIKREPITDRINMQGQPIGLDFPDRSVVPRVRPQLPTTGSAPTITRTTFQQTRANIRQRLTSFGSRITSLFRRKKQ